MWFIADYIQKLPPNGIPYKCIFVTLSQAEQGRPIFFSFLHLKHTFSCKVNIINAKPKPIYHFLKLLTLAPCPTLQSPLTIIFTEEGSIPFILAQSYQLGSLGIGIAQEQESSQAFIRSRSSTYLSALLGEHECNVPMKLPQSFLSSFTKDSGFSVRCGGFYFTNMVATQLSSYRLFNNRTLALLPSTLIYVPLPEWG